MRFAPSVLAAVALLGLAGLPGLAAAQQSAPPPQAAPPTQAAPPPPYYGPQPYPAPPPYYGPQPYYAPQPPPYYGPQPYPPPYYGPQPYPAPYYAPPPYYPPPQPPQPQVPAGPAIIEDWKPGEPIPEGYRPESRVNWETVKAGGGMLFVCWLPAVIVGIIGSELEDEGAEDGDGIEPSDYTPLYIPVLGPFAAIATLDAEKGGLGLLLLDGVGQVVGAAGLILGIADRDHYLVRETAGIRITPAVGQGYSGLRLTGHF